MAIVDSGFKGDLELPASLQDELQGRFVGRVSSLLAAGQVIEEDVYLVDFPFDGQVFPAEATFVTADDILIGTHLLRQHRLVIDFPGKAVLLDRAISAGDYT